MGRLEAHLTGEQVDLGEASHQARQP